MTDSKKIYTIQINGIQESIDAVKVLNEQLNALDARIKNLDEAVKVNVGGSNSTQSLEEQDKLQKELLATERKIAEVRDESYKKLLNMKEELKEYTQIAKSQVAAEANSQGLFDTSTMAGIKAQLKSVKQEMQTVQIDGNRFKELVAQANELNNKLKEVEQSYGQYGRNVGNYANGVAEGLEKLKINVGGVIKEFDNAKQAMVELRKEMQTLSVKKDLGIISEEETERLKSLIPTFKELESSVKDAGKPMDGLMDSMQGLVAIASTAQGIGALFGFDDNAIEQSIQKLVALQNVLQGIQTIQTQMKAQDGIGMIISRGNGAIDKMAKSIIGVSTATKGATIATKALSLALKGIGWGIVIAGVSALVSVIGDFIDKQKKAREETERVRKVEKDAAVAYGMAKSELSAYKSIVDNFNGTKKEEDNLVKELNKKYGTALGTYKSLAEWKTILTTKTEDYCKALMMEVELQAAADRYKEALQNQKDAENYEVGFWESIFEGSSAVRTRVKALADQEVKEAKGAYEAAFKKYQGQIQSSNLFDFAPQIEKNGKKTKKAVSDVEGEINRIRIEAMREGLNKTIAQLEEEKRQRINKIKANGQRVAELTQATEALYQQKIEDARRDFADKLKEQEEKMWQEIGSIGSDAAAKASENIIKSSENSIDKGIDRLQQKLKAIYSNYAPDFGNISDATLSKAGSIEGAIRNGDIKAPDGRVVNVETLKATQEYLNILQDIDETEAQIYLARRKMGGSSNPIFDGKGLEDIDKQIADLKTLLEQFKQMQSESANLNLEEEFNKLYSKTGEEYKKYLDDKIKAEKEAANKSLEIERQRIKDEYKLMEERYIDEKYQELNGLATKKGYEKNPIENQLKLQEISVREYNEKIAELDAKYAKLASDTEVKYSEDILAFAEERDKKLEELKEKHRQTLLEIDHKYDGKTEENRKNAFDEYVKDFEARNKKIEDLIRETNNNIAEAEAARESIINGQSQDANEGEVDARIVALTTKLEELKRIKDEYLEDLHVSEEQMEESIITMMLRNDNYTSDLSKQFIARLGNHIKYYDEVEKLERNHFDTVLAEQKKSLDAQAETDKANAMKRLKELKDSLEEQEKLEINSVQGEDEINKVREKYQIQREAAEEATIKYIEEITKQHNEDSERAEIEHQNNIKGIAARTQDNIISEYRDFYSKLANVQSSAPITNDWGIINLSKTREQNKKLLESYTYLSQQIVSQKLELQAKLDANEISFDDFTQASRELNDLQTSVASALNNIEKNMKESFGKFWGSIDQWLQAVGQTMNQILGSLSEIQSNQYDKMIDQQEKYIEEYEKMLDKQKEITQEHADAVDSIEDELSTARGDRRQQLIDQLNAEMAAQRASLAQQQRIDKEKEKAEHKKADLEYEQAKARKRMQESQALINAAMAVSMAAVNNWPIPAIPMMALAAATGAAQYAAVKSQYIPKPSYGDGGVIIGKSHKDGGVPVLGGRAEVEGGEFITNKVTTSKNVDLLEYINTKRKKISLEDLIDFYGGNSQVKKSITTVRTKFADGGVIPTLRNDINLSDRMLTAFEDYSNRPVQVAVVDIIDRTQAVNDVRVMAGLE